MNTFIGNIQSNINHLYRLVKKRDLPLFLSEQEWRINHRYSGKRIMDKVKKYISMSTPVTFKQITNSVLAYEKQFLFCPEFIFHLRYTLTLFLFQLDCLRLYFQALF